MFDEGSHQPPEDHGVVGEAEDAEKSLGEEVDGRHDVDDGVDKQREVPSGHLPVVPPQGGPHEARRGIRPLAQTGCTRA